MLRMAMSKLRLVLQNTLLNRLQTRFYAKKYEYEMPETYRNAFYHANATLEDNTNWFVHNAMGIIYTELIHTLKDKGYRYSQAKKEISNIINLLESCADFIDIKFPLRCSNGDYKIVRGFRAEHGLYIRNRPCLGDLLYDDQLGTKLGKIKNNYKTGLNRIPTGGLRLCEKIEKSEIRALASLSTYKYACMGINMLGAHGGILVAPEEVTQNELQSIIETYTGKLTKKGFCGESIDIFEPDIKCGHNEIAWVIAANSKTRGEFGNASAVGKPVQFGGIQNREKAVAQGIAFGLDTFLHNQRIMKKIGLETGWNKKTFILQGLGSVGSYTARYFISMGLKCVGIIENDCYIYDKKGINIKEAILYKSKHKSLDGFQMRTKMNEPRALTKDCDILVLAATQNSLPYHIADKVKAKIIVEAANGPITPTVHKVFVGRQKLVLPDIYINSGSSVASYFEYLKNLHHLPIENIENDFDDEFSRILKLSMDEFVNKRLDVVKYDRKALRERIKLDPSEKSVVTGAIDNIMEETAQGIIATAQIYQLELDFRTAAYINALKKLFWTAFTNFKSCA